MEAGGDPFEGPTAARTLDQIREGGSLLVAAAVSRLEEASEAVRTGRFDRAVGLVEEAVARLRPLASAQHYMAALTDGTFLVRARDLEEGAHIVHVGRVTHIEIERERTPGSVDEIETVVCTIDGESEPARFYGQQELICWAEAQT